MVTVDPGSEPLLPPDDAIPFACSCHCFNVRIVGRAEAYLKDRIHDEPRASQETSLHRVWLDDAAGPSEQLVGSSPNSQVHQLILALSCLCDLGVRGGQKVGKASG